MKHNYDTVAWCYDRFSRLVFGNIQVKAQQSLLSAIPAGAHLLIAGGGTGWILEEIIRIHPSGLTITYVDSSEEMVALSRKRNTGGNSVRFIVANIEDVMSAGQYDAVMTPFLFDNFTQVNASQLFHAIDKQITPGGIWLYCDFHDTGIFWQRLLMKMMYAFFRVCCGVKATHMPDMAACFGRQYIAAAQQTFMKGFIVSAVYQKES